MPRQYRRKSALPEDATLPLDARGRPNRSYLGHTSEFFETPYPFEGMFLEPGMPRRIPLVKERTYAMEQERRRLARIENPGRCQARLRKVDAWCSKEPMKGLAVCYRHGGAFAHSKQAAARRVKEQELMDGARKIIKQAKK